MRLIDADKKITVTYYDEEYEEWSQKTRTIWDTILEVADEIPPVVDAVPVKHGHWIRCGVHGELCLCSECGKIFNWPMKYCGCCGAKMDEVER